MQLCRRKEPKGVLGETFDGLLPRRPPQTGNLRTPPGKGVEFTRVKDDKEPGNAETKRWFSAVGELLSKHHGKELFVYRIHISADRKRRKELNVEGIDRTCKDIEMTLNASEYAYLELLPLDD